MRLSPIGENTERLRSSIEEMLLAHYRGDDQVAAVPPPDAKWINHLLDLRARIDTNVLYPRDLQAVESQGLVLLNQVMEELKARTKCPHCHLPSKTFTHCEHCKRPIPAGGKS
ncbi:hypothetical protein LCGC14_0782790 [marine sediment metagenome]|uniref:Uncharacterized protein n=1 Tax=marine sediment metagenome TaxID=412755 RepID=A0A0F9SET7_9ZZZZ